MTTWRLVQKGHGPVVVGYLLGSHIDTDLRDALPGLTIVATAEAPLQGALAGALKAAGAEAGADVVLIGYSAGCQPVRAHLVAGLEPVAVVTIDGTHASLPAAPWQLEVWRKLAEEARRGARMWVATCTAMKYTEQIPIGQKGRAMATSHVLEHAVGQLLPPGTAIHDGALHVISYPSKDVDQAAHIAQQREALPLVLREHVAPWLANLDAAPSTDRSPVVISVSDPPPLMSLADAGDFGAAVLQVALEDMNRAPREKGKNAGAFIRDTYLAPLGLPEGSSYCAAAVTSWMHRAAERTGLPMPISGSAGAQTLMTQLKAAGRWVPRAKLSPDMIRPGMLLVWDRSTPGKPETVWQGHVGCAISGVGERSAGLVEANADRLVEPITHEVYAVIQTERRLDDPRLFGAGYLGEMPGVA